MLYTCAYLYLSLYFYVYNIDVRVNTQMQMAQLVPGVVVQLWFELLLTLIECLFCNPNF